MGTTDLVCIMDCSHDTILRYVGETKVLVNDNEMINFKKEISNLLKTLADMVILYRKEVMGCARK